VQKRFSASKADAVQEILSLFKKLKEFVFGNFYAGVLVKDKLAVVAERAAKVAFGQEKGTGNLAWKVNQGGFLNSLEKKQEKTPVALNHSGLVPFLRHKFFFR